MLANSAEAFPPFFKGAIQAVPKSGLRSILWQKRNEGAADGGSFPVWGLQETLVKECGSLILASLIRTRTASHLYETAKGGHRDESD